MTAAHCVYDKDGEMISERTLCVLLGLHDRTKKQHQEQERWDTLGKASMKKKTFSFGHCPNYLIPPPMTPTRATWSSFFGSQNSRFESQFRTKNTIYTI